jgi:hypothetical protein
MKELLPYLQSNLKLIKVHDDKGGYEYYSCGQPHDSRNPAWKPFQNLEACCREKRCDFETVKGMIEDRLYRKLICDCEILTNPYEIRRKGLEQVFGMDSGAPGNRKLDVF